jgi:hypothetical protein
MSSRNPPPRSYVVNRNQLHHCETICPYTQLQNIGITERGIHLLSSHELALLKCYLVFLCLFDIPPSMFSACSFSHWSPNPLQCLVVMCSLSSPLLLTFLCFSTWWSPSSTKLNQDIHSCYYPQLLHLPPLPRMFQRGSGVLVLFPPLIAAGSYCLHLECPQLKPTILKGKSLYFGSFSLYNVCASPRYNKR